LGGGLLDDNWSPTGIIQRGCGGGGRKKKFTGPLSTKRGRNQPSRQSNKTNLRNRVEDENQNRPGTGGKAPGQGEGKKGKATIAGLGLPGKATTNGRGGTTVAGPKTRVKKIEGARPGESRWAAPKCNTIRNLTCEDGARKPSSNKSKTKGGGNRGNAFVKPPRGLDTQRNKNEKGSTGGPQKSGTMPALEGERLKSMAAVGKSSYEVETQGGRKGTQERGGKCRIPLVKRDLWGNQTTNATIVSP